ncbi:MAG TPA: MgtC/SapB family protein [Solirubrobacteraceae bacterium]|nr:MgtC/SapB family protein [Solirubrobacteraceae bacterium]
MSELDIIWRLGLALVLSSLIGLEREVGQKSAGLRTYTLVGVGAAVFMLVSIYGFSASLGTHVVLDPSRVAAQIVSGIGFIGGGIIFVRRDTVRGLTTAAGVWVTAGVGMACGGDLPLIAVATTAIYMLVAFGYPFLVRVLPRSRFAPSELRLVYVDGRGLLREALAECAQRGFSISDLEIKHEHDGDRDGGPRHVTVALEVRGQGSVTQLASELNELEGVVGVYAGDVDELGY